jgi:hypothetical protein
VWFRPRQSHELPPPEVGLSIPPAETDTIRT